MTEYKKQEIENLPILEEGQYYIYVLLNYPDGNIKIGRTSNLKQRIQSLSGSNGAGNQIIDAFWSPPTYLYTAERACHEHFHYARIPNTEWFDGTKVSFDTVKNYLRGLFLSSSYQKCNQLRRQVFLKQKGEQNDEQSSGTMATISL